MQIKKRGNNYLDVYDCPFDDSKFLGYRRAKNSPYVTVEDNIVNRILLDINPSYFCKNSNVEGLKDYQRYDVGKMLHLGNVLNRNPMGLGKTVEAIATIREANAKHVLVVAPKIVLQQWVDQINIWWPDHFAEIYRGNFTDINSAPVIIINYEKLLNNVVQRKLKMFQWDFLIIDEAHRIKNPKSKRTLAIKSIPSAKRIALTGTPILNKPDDLWSILHFLDWRYSGISYWNFVGYFCKIREDFWGRHIEGLTKDEEKVVLLNQLLHYISVYNPVQVTSGKTQNTISLKMTSKQRKMYKDMKNLVLDELPGNANISNGAVLTIRLSQVTSWPGLFIENESGPKFEWILNTCLDNPQEKFLVFTRFATTAKALEKYLENNSIKTSIIIGEKSVEEREDAKKHFITQNQVLIGTIGAMGQGFDKLQNVCHICIFIDRDWSPEIMSQCEGRLDRMGQQYPVMSYILECQDSFDKHIGKVNIHKSEDIRRALKNDD